MESPRGLIAQACHPQVEKPDGVGFFLGVFWDHFPSKHYPSTLSKLFPTVLRKKKILSGRLGYGPSLLTFVLAQIFSPSPFSAPREYTCTLLAPQIPIQL